MRNFKIFLWIFVIFLVQTVVLSPIHIFGAVPSAVLAFVMCVATVSYTHLDVYKRQEYMKKRAEN